jgi:hypothetical protein
MIIMMIDMVIQIVSQVIVQLLDDSVVCFFFFSTQGLLIVELI